MDLTPLRLQATQLYDWIYRSAYDQPGAEPYGLLVGLYEIGANVNDLATLRSIGKICALSFCPFVCAAASSLLGLESYLDLDHLDLPSAAADLEYASMEEGVVDEAGARAATDALRVSRRIVGAWRGLRATDAARFLGLTMPRIVVRRPHEKGYSCVSMSRCEDCRTTTMLDAAYGCRTCASKKSPAVYSLGFAFRETIEQDADLLTGSAAICLASVIARSFTSSGWFQDTRGVVATDNRRDARKRGGWVPPLLPWVDDTREPERLRISTAECILDENQEAALASMGFIPLVQTTNSHAVVFYSLATAKGIRRASPRSDVPPALSDSLHMVLCGCRFAHYIKRIGHRLVGSGKLRDEVRQELHRWLVKYTSSDPNIAEEDLARMPLRGSEVQISTDPDYPDELDVRITLQMRSHLDTLSASIKIASPFRIARPKDAS